MNEYTLAFVLSLCVNAVLWLRILQYRDRDASLLAENYHLFTNSIIAKEIIMKLRSELKKEQKHEILYRPGVPEN